MPGRGQGSREAQEALRPLRALKHRGLLTISLTALCYNWAFFTVLGYAPFPMDLGPIKLGLVFTGFLTTAHRLLNQAERVQAEQVTGSAASTRPAASADAELLRG